MLVKVKYIQHRLIHKLVICEDDKVSFYMNLLQYLKTRLTILLIFALKWSFSY